MKKCKINYKILFYYLSVIFFMSSCCFEKRIKNNQLSSLNLHKNIPVEILPNINIKINKENNKIKKKNYNKELFEILNNMILENKISQELIFVNDINNENLNNFSLHNIKKDVILTLLKINKNINIIDYNIFSKYENKFSSFEESILDNCNKTIEIARNVKAKYMLCTNIFENKQLRFKLILVDTGEIIWNN